MLNFKLKIDSIKNVNQSTNHVFVVDVSGSMYDVLPKIKNHIKSKLSLLVKDNDTVSIIYFSSKNQFGVVFEGEKIKDLSDLSKLHQSIDKFLSTLCLTGFVQPIEEAINVAKRLKYNQNINNFIFMTDGFDNQWSKKEILDTCKLLPEYFDSISFIEYGWYCNRKLLSEMSEISGASHIFSEEYNQYEPIFEKLLQKQTVKRKQVNIETQYAYYVDNNEIIIVEKQNNCVLVPENIDTLYLLDNNINLNSLTDDDKYLLLYVSIHKMNNELIWKTLKSLGDVHLIKMLNNCFSKQEYSNSKEFVKQCVFNDSQRFINGIDYNLIPKDDAYTVLNLLNDLMVEGNFLQTNHESFNYNRIGANLVQKNIHQEQIDKLKEDLKNTNNIEEIRKISLELYQLDFWNPKFTEIKSELGEPINNLIFNESRPNISIQIVKNGFVELPDDKVKEFNLPKNFNTHIFRNYTIIKDGILNMKVLPVKLNFDTYTKLKNENIINEEYSNNKTFLLDLTSLPLINRTMIKKVNANNYFTKNIVLQELKSKQKVFKYFLDEIQPKQQVKLLSLYTEPAVQWLESIGIKDYGFSPKVTVEKSGDFYYSKELNIKIKGLSSIPSVKAVLEKIKNNSKLNSSDKLVQAAINEYYNFINLDTIKNSSVKDTLIITWLEAETKKIIQSVRSLQKELNQTLYSIIIGQTWFEEFSSLDENELTINYKNDDYKVQALLEEKEIPI